MTWRHVSLGYLHRAMDMIDREGRDVIRSAFHFQPAKSRLIYLEGRGGYEARLLIAVAHALQYPNQPRLLPANFSGDGNSPLFFLEALGFEARAIG